MKKKCAINKQVNSSHAAVTVKPHIPSINEEIKKNSKNHIQVWKDISFSFALKRERKTNNNDDDDKKKLKIFDDASNSRTDRNYDRNEIKNRTRSSKQ